MEEKKYKAIIHYKSDKFTGSIAGEVIAVSVEQAHKQLKQTFEEVLKKWLINEGVGVCSFVKSEITKEK